MNRLKINQIFEKCISQRQIGGQNKKSLLA